MSIFDERYEVLNIISAGQFDHNNDEMPSVVDTFCQRRKDNVNVLVKAFKMSAIEDVKDRARILTEANLFSEINRPNIVKILSCFQGMADVLGEKSDHFAEKQIGYWFVQVAAALAHLHHKDLLHRNIKTSTAFLDHNKRVIKLGGFMSARSLNKTVLTTDHPDNVKHHAPELSELVSDKLDRLYIPESDVWSLGVLLYEITTLTPPFEAGNQQQLFRKIAGSKPKEIPSRYSRGLRRLLNHLLAKSPNDRPTMDQVLTDVFVRKHAAALFPEMIDKLFETLA